jgi:alanyl-tRNA synthetase
MGEQYMTIDISLEENPNFTKVTWEMAKHAELCANQVIWSNAPVITRRFETREEAEGLPLRKALALDEDISIVCVGSIDEPADCVACCGTHPSTAGQVGMVKIYKVESNKGMFRIYMEAGQRAFQKYQGEYDTMIALGNQLSAGPDDLMEKYHAQQEKQNAVRMQLGQLRRLMVSQEAERIKAVLAAGESQTDGAAELVAASGLAAATGAAQAAEGASSWSHGNLICTYHVLTLDDLLNIAKELFSEIPKVLFLVHVPSHTVLLCSSGQPDCGKLVKENVSIYGGKGGGGATSARAIFQKDEYVDTFIDLISNHLR